MAGRVGAMLGDGLGALDAGGYPTNPPLDPWDADGDYMCTDMFLVGVGRGV